MGWLTEAFAEQSVVWLFITTIAALVSGFLSSWLTSRYITRREVLDQAAIQKEVESYLGDKSAEREYNLEARKRLYHAIGPLKFQLLLACRDLAVRSFNLHTEVYANTIYGYYGRSTLYRILRPIAIAEIIEQQITYADFSIDQSAIGLLRFKKAAYMALTDGKPILDHPNIDWSRQKEHLYSGTLGNLAYSLIVEDEDASVKSRPMQFHEFQVFIEKPGNLNLFAPLTNILDDFSIEMKPIFWIRLISLGYICNEYVKREGRDIGFETSYFNLRNLILASKDEFISSHIDEYEKAV